MTSVAPTLQAFFTERLIAERRASPHTIAAYRDTFRLLLGFAEDRLGGAPSKLAVQDLDADLIGAFLDHLEADRANSIRTRNACLAAVHSFFRYAALRHPEHAAVIERVLAVPPKRFERHTVSFLTDPEVDALLAAPDPATWLGRRDHALILTPIQTGLRVSELANLHCADAFPRQQLPGSPRPWPERDLRELLTGNERQGAQGGRPRRKLRDWHLNRRSGTDLAGLARAVNAQVPGWFNYYGKFYRSKLYPIAGRIDERLVRWAMQKFKRLLVCWKAEGP